MTDFYMKRNNGLNWVDLGYLFVKFNIYFQNGFYRDLDDFVRNKSTIGWISL